MVLYGSIENHKIFGRIRVGLTRVLEVRSIVCANVRVHCFFFEFVSESVSENSTQLLSYYNSEFVFELTISGDLGS